MKLAHLLCIPIFLMTNTASAQMPHFRLSLDGQWFFKADTAKVGLDDRWYQDSLDRSDWQLVGSHEPGDAGGPPDSDRQVQRR